MSLQDSPEIGHGSLRQPDPAHHRLKARVFPQRVHSGIHPEPYQSSRALAEGLLQRLVGVVVFSKTQIDPGDEKAADVSFLF